MLILTFVLETDASKIGLGAVLSQYQEDGKLHPVAYASRSVSTAESNYATTNLETLAVVWSVTHFKYYLYGHKVTIITDHAAVKAILRTPNLSGQHARWWSKLYGSGIKELDIVHRAGRNNLHVDALSRQPVLPAITDAEVDSEVQVAQISVNVEPDPDTVGALLGRDPMSDNVNKSNLFAEEQLKDIALKPIIAYILQGIIPEEPQLATRTVTQAPLYTMMDGILYYTGQKGDPPKAVVPSTLKQSMIKDYHSGIMAGHFSRPKIYKAMAPQW